MYNEIAFKSDDMQIVLNWIVNEMDFESMLACSTENSARLKLLCCALMSF